MNRKSKKHYLATLLIVALFFLTPLLSAYVANLAKVRTEPSLQEDLQQFREMAIDAERLAGYENWSDDEYNQLAKDYLYYDGKIAKDAASVSSFSWYSLLFPKERAADYKKAYRAILGDMQCFPVADEPQGEETVRYSDSWGASRNYGGDRIHEGTDIMSSNNERGYFPIVSVGDGVVEKKGWLQLGGYRLGIRGAKGAYFYYAHLASYEDGIEEGTRVKAGQVIGYMGDSGYGAEGTVGKFDVHLHFGIYIPVAGEDVSVNPYEVLRAVQKKEKK